MKAKRIDNSKPKIYNLAISNPVTSGFSKFNTFKRGTRVDTSVKSTPNQFEVILSNSELLVSFELKPICSKILSNLIVREALKNSNTYVQKRDAVYFVQLEVAVKENKPYQNYNLTIGGLKMIKEEVIQTQR